MVQRAVAPDHVLACTMSAVCAIACGHGANLHGIAPPSTLDEHGMLHYMPCHPHASHGCHAHICAAVQAAMHQGRPHTVIVCRTHCQA